MTKVVVQEIVRKLTIQGRVHRIAVGHSEIRVVTVGVQGPPGAGHRPGGTAGQVMAKVTDADYDSGWITLTKAMVGLGNVANLAPADYPVSTAQQAALDLKANLAGATFSGPLRLPAGLIGAPALVVEGTSGFMTPSGGTAAWVSGGGEGARLEGTLGFGLRASAGIWWGSGALGAYSQRDTGISRNGPGLVYVGNGTPGNASGALAVAQLLLNPEGTVKVVAPAANTLDSYVNSGVASRMNTAGLALAGHLALGPSAVAPDIYFSRAGAGDVNLGSTTGATNGTLRLATVRNPVGALTLSHGPSDDVRVQPFNGGLPTLGFYSAGTVLQTQLVAPSQDVLEQRRGVNAQKSYLYKTWSNAGVDFERLSFGSSSNAFDISTERGGTGVIRQLRLFTTGLAELQLGTNNTIRWRYDVDGHYHPASDALYDVGGPAAKVRTVYAQGISSGGSSNPGMVGGGNGWLLDGSYTTQARTVGLVLKSTGIIGMTDGTSYSGTIDVAFSRAGPGVYALGTGAQGSTAGQLNVTGVHQTVGTVAGLPTPTAGLKGLERMVGDALNNTRDAVVAPAGSTLARVRCDGTDWRIV